MNVSKLGRSAAYFFFFKKNIAYKLANSKNYNVSQTAVYDAAEGDHQIVTRSKDDNDMANMFHEIENISFGGDPWHSLSHEAYLLLHLKSITSKALAASYN